MPPQTTVPPLRHRLQRRRHQLARRGEDQRGVQLLGRRAGASPAHSAPSSRAKACVALSSARVNANTRRPWWTATWQTMWAARAEAVDAEPLGVAGHHQRAVADQPGAQQRRGLEVGVAVREREAEALVRHGQLGVAAVAVVAGEAGARRRGSRGPIGSSGRRRRSSPATARPRARRAGSARRASTTRATIWCPGTSGSLGRSSSPSRMCRSVRQTAQAATSQEHLARTRLRVGQLGEPQRRPRRFQDHRAHAAKATPRPPRATR